MFIRYPDTVRSLNFSPNGQCIVTSFQDKVIIWRLRDGSSRVLNLSERDPFSTRFSLDGRYVVYGCFGKIVIGNVLTGKLVARWQGHSNYITSLAFTPDGKGLLSGSWDKEVKQWDVSSLSSLGIGTPNPPIFSMTEVSRLIGHTVSWPHSLFILLSHPSTPSTRKSSLFRGTFCPSLFLLMVNGLPLAQRIKL